MEYKISKISEKIRVLSEDESRVIKQAIPFYKNMLDKYEKILLKAKEENDKVNEKPKNLDEINPFDYKDNNEKNYIPTEEEIRTFVYSLWAKTVADVQTPYASTGQTKKNIVKHSFKDVQKGKYINKNVRDIMKDFISKLIIALDIKKDENND